jgi:undecaprenyl-diphosphatase
MNRPSLGDGRDLLIRVVGPAVALWAVILGIGLILTGPLAAPIRAEDAVSQGLASARTAGWNSITFVWSHIANIEIIIAVTLAMSGLLLWRARDWRLAAVPALAVLLQFVIFDTVSTLVGRDRPPVPELDLAPPTTSFPSGHVSAATALYVTLALLALRIRHDWIGRITIIVCLAIPLLVAFARLYRGMHHPTDVAAGLLNGIVCALLAVGWYRRRSAAAGSRGS